MSNKLDQIKNKIRAASGPSVHSQLIDTNVVEEEKQAKIKVNVNDDVNVNVVKTFVQSTDGSSSKAPLGKIKKQKFEERYKRDTFWIRNDLKEKLDSFCEGEKGEKTRVINEALESYFNKMKKR